MISRFHAHVHVAFWPVLWWNLFAYLRWRRAAVAAGAGHIFVRVSRWGEIVVDYVLDAPAAAPAWHGAIEAGARALARLRAPSAVARLLAGLHRAFVHRGRAPTLLAGHVPRPAICDSS